MIATEVFRAACGLAAGIQDVWSLTHQQRVVVLQRAAKAASADARKNFAACLDALRSHTVAHDEVSRLRKVRCHHCAYCACSHTDEFVRESASFLQLSVMGSRKVVGATTNGAAANLALIQQLRPAVVLIEEAAEVLEPIVVGALPSTVQVSP